MRGLTWDWIILCLFNGSFLDALSVCLFFCQVSIHPAASVFECLVWVPLISHHPEMVPREQAWPLPRHDLYVFEPNRWPWWKPTVLGSKTCPGIVFFFFSCLSLNFMFFTWSLFVIASIYAQECLNTFRSLQVCYLFFQCLFLGQGICFRQYF
jgi:hypothetical protein